MKNNYFPIGNKLSQYNAKNIVLNYLQAILLVITVISSFITLLDNGFKWIWPLLIPIACFSFFIMITLLLAIRKKTVHSYETFKYPNNVFLGVFTNEKLSEVLANSPGTILQREMEMRRIIHALENQYTENTLHGGKGYLSLVGKSGTGKSILISLLRNDIRKKKVNEKYITSTELVECLRNEKCNVIYLEELYTTFTDQNDMNMRYLSSSKSSENEMAFDSILQSVDNFENVILIVCDQFESYLLDNSKKIFLAYLIKEVSHNYITLFITRKEYYLDLIQFMSECGKEDLEFLCLDGIKPTTDPTDLTAEYNILKTKFKMIFGDDQCDSEKLDSALSHIGLFNEKNPDEVNLIEAQIIGQFLHRYTNEHRCILDAENGDAVLDKFKKNFKTKMDIITAFFEEVLVLSNNYLLAQQILFILSLRMNANNYAMDSYKLQKYVFSSKHEIDTCLLKLTEVGIIKPINTSSKCDNYLYAISHDYVAEKYMEYSSIKMDSQIKENLIYLCGDATKKDVSMFIDEISPQSNTNKRLRILLNIWYGILLLFIFSGTTLLPALPYYANTSALFFARDISSFIYVFTALPILIATTYLYLLAKNLLVYYKKRSYFSYTILGGFITVSLSCFINDWYITLLGIEGVIIGIAYLQLGMRITKSATLISIGRNTIVTNFIIAGLGTLPAIFTSFTSLFYIGLSTYTLFIIVALYNHNSDVFYQRIRGILARRER